MMWHVMRTVSDGRAIILIAYTKKCILKVWGEVGVWKMWAQVGIAISIYDNDYLYECSVANIYVYLSDYWWAGVVEYLSLFRVFQN